MSYSQSQYCPPRCPVCNGTLNRMDPWGLNGPWFCVKCQKRFVLEHGNLVPDNRPFEGSKPDEPTQP